MTKEKYIRAKTILREIDELRQLIADPLEPGYTGFNNRYIYSAEHDEKIVSAVREKITALQSEFDSL